MTTMTSLLTADDLHYFSEGTHGSLASVLGSHPRVVAGVEGTTFGVWAPNAERVSVVGDFNGWDRQSAPLEAIAGSGIWEGFVPGVGHGAVYKYHIASRHHGYQVDKADPLALCCEEPPRTASVVWQLDYRWGDAAWMADRHARNAFGAPISVYEVHLGSWRRSPDDPRGLLGYRELAPALVEHVTRLGFTHVELLPIMEHPFYGSWGYQTTGYFAPTRRYGDPEDFMWLVDQLHQAGIGVILDWVPSHFPEDEHGLSYFDGTHLYEHSDPRQGFHPDWKSAIFNYSRNEVRSFLTSSAAHWLDAYHADGIRVDAVASMLYLDYSRKEGEWIPNAHGGRENLDAIEFLRHLNTHAYRTHPDVQMIAEESTSWPMVSRPTEMGGLGFGLKWDMGWMHDTLEYFKNDPIHRGYHQGELTFRALYAFTENFMLPLSHDEVVHGKGSLISNMPGDEWQRFANLRLLYGYMYACSGKKLLFMGDEFAQNDEWSHEKSLDWHLLDAPLHAQVQQFVADLNRTYRAQPALHELDVEGSGFEWVDASDEGASVLSFLRRSTGGETILCVLNLTPVPRASYRIGVPREGTWRELLNSDASIYGGSGQGNLGAVEALPVPMHGRRSSVLLTLPPLSVVLLRHEEPTSST
jgi:1,4-alpha-glucan branching enzyme